MDVNLKIDCIKEVIDTFNLDETYTIQQYKNALNEINDILNDN